MPPYAGPPSPHFAGGVLALSISSLPFLTIAIPINGTLAPWLHTSAHGKLLAVCSGWWPAPSALPPTDGS